MLHTHCNNDFLANSVGMNAQIELNSVAMSKNDPKMVKLEKYDVEANIEEIDNSEEQSIYKFGVSALSNPKNVRLAIEGIAKISGDAIERNDILEKDENDVPKILTLIYQELFPTFFLLSKSLNVFCPPHTIGSVGTSPDSELEQESSNIPEASPEASPEVNDTQVETNENPDVVKPTL